VRASRSLPVHERLAAIVVCLFFGLIVTFNGFSRRPPSLQELGAPHWVASQMVEVSIRGAVDAPGTYLLPQGAKVSDLLQIAKPIPQANLKRLDIDAPIRNGQQIVLKELRRAKAIEVEESADFKSQIIADKCL
jgi:hypothetical protein